MAKRSARTWIIALALALGATASVAANAPRAASPLAALFACRAASDDNARLRCYDDQVAALERLESSGGLVAVDALAVESIERESFGFDLRTLSGVLSDPNRDELADVTFTVERVMQASEGRSLFVMASGERWLQIEPRSAGNVRPGDAVVIRRAAMGSYVLSPQRGPAHRVRRQN